MSRYGDVRRVEKTALTDEERSRLLRRERSTLKLAALLGVSHDTAEELASAEGRVTPATLARVRERMKALGL